MRAARCLLAPVRLAARRLAADPARPALVALGVAAGAALLGVVQTGSLVGEDLSLRRALERLPDAERAVHVAYAGPPREGGWADTLDPAAVDALAAVGLEPAARAMQFRLTLVEGTPVNLGALEPLGRWVRLGSGRLPRSCTPSRCEVVQVAGEGTVPSEPGIRLAVVGRGSLVSQAPFGRLPGAGGVPIGDSFALERTPPFVLAGSVAELASLPALEPAYRTYAWVALLAPAAVRPWTADGFARDAAGARASLLARSGNFDLVAPLPELRTAARESRVAGRRLLLLGGQGAALLLALAVLAAAASRRDTEEAWRRLTWVGARRWQLLAVSATEALAAALAGAALGWGLGVAGSAALARGAGAPLDLLRHTVLAPRAVPGAAAVALAAALVVLLALRAPALSVRGRGVGPLDVAALGAAAAVGLVLLRGDADPAALGDGGTGVVLLLLPSLVLLAAATAAARLVGPLLRLLERAARGRSLPLRLAALSLARSPGAATVAVTFLVVGVGLAVFAAAYRSTLERGRDEAVAFASPAELVVRERLDPGGLVAPLDAAPLERWRDLGAATPVLRRNASVGRVAGGAAVTLLGLPAGARVDGWRDDFGAATAAAALRAVAGNGETLRGARVPAWAERLELEAELDGDPVTVLAALRLATGAFAEVELGRALPGRRTLGAAAPAGSLLLGLRLSTSARDQHSSASVDGRLRLGPLVAVGGGRAETLVGSYAGWLGSNGVRRGDDGRLRFLVGDQAPARFRPPQPREGEPVPLLASPGLAAGAAPDGTLVLRVGSGLLHGRVAAVVRRFPSLRGEFAVADLGRLSLALDPERPGLARPNELWLRGADEAALARPPFDVLAVTSRRELAAEARADPLARGTLLALAAAAGVAALVGLAGLALAVASSLRDEGRALIDLAEQGLAPAALRGHVRLRALVVCALGLALGLAAGAALAALVVDLVALTAAGGRPEPPLRLAADAPLLAGALLAYAAAMGTLVSFAARRARS